MVDTTITYFPVGNGDTSLIELSDRTQIIIDCRIRAPGEGIYDVGKHLRDGARKTGDVKHVDAFVLTHPDQDHCLGFRELFYTGDAAGYTAAHAKKGLLRIDELWFTPRIFDRYEEAHNDLCEDAKAIRKEADRRVALYEKKDAKRNEPGNRIRVIGFTPRPGLEDVQTTPGNEVATVNAQKRDDIGIFVHAPFKRNTAPDEMARNESSLVLHIKFHSGAQKGVVKAFFGGDAGWRVWTNILKLSRDEDLEYDLFLAPHHSSWTYFNDVPYEDFKEPLKEPLDLLSKKRTGARVIASSKPIRDDDDNPPHFAAAEEYRKVVGKENFVCTGETPDEKNPKPLVFTVTTAGVRKVDARVPGAVVAGAAGMSALRAPQTYG